MTFLDKRPFCYLIFFPLSNSYIFMYIILIFMARLQIQKAIVYPFFFFYLFLCTPSVASTFFVTSSEKYSRFWVKPKVGAIKKFCYRLTHVFVDVRRWGIFLYDHIQKEVWWVVVFLAMIPCKCKQPKTTIFILISAGIDLLVSERKMSFSYYS